MNSIISILIIITSLLNSIFASNFKRKNYIYGLICYLLMGLVAYKNQIYGMFSFYIFIFSPLQIFGFINWNKKDKNNNLEVRSFSNKNRRKKPNNNNSLYSKYNIKYLLFNYN